MFIRTLDENHHQFSLVFMFSLQLPACIFLSTILLGDVLFYLFMKIKILPRMLQIYFSQFVVYKLLFNLV